MALHQFLFVHCLVLLTILLKQSEKFLETFGNEWHKAVVHCVCMCNNMVVAII